MNHREVAGIVHLRGRHIHGLFAHQRRDGIQPRRKLNIGHHPHNHGVLVHGAAHRIGSVEEFVCESPVDDHHRLRIGAVRQGKAAPLQQRNLQRIEVARRNVHHVGPELLPGLFAIVDGDRVVQGALIGQGQSDGRILHAGNPLHGGSSLIEKFSEGRRVVIARIVQRRLGSHHP